jgi:hypothetical protein
MEVKEENIWDSNHCQKMKNDEEYSKKMYDIFLFK